MKKPEGNSNTFRSSHPDNGQAIQAFNTPVERAIYGIWKGVLSCSIARANQNFYSLGGTADQAEQITEEIREIFSIDFPIPQLFDHPTIAQQAAFIDSLRSTGKRSGLSIPRIERSQYIPLSLSQQRLWFFEQLEPDSALYNATLSFKISGALEVDQLIRTLNEIVRRHEALRTIFRSVEGQVFQSIIPQLSLDLQRFDLRGFNSQKQEREITRLSSEEARLPYDLACGPLIRTKLIQIDTEKFILLLSIHHIVSDGWSMTVLVKEIETIYAAFRAGLPCPLSELPVQYVDYCHWQNLRQRGDFLETHLDYWREKLRDIPAEIDLPTDHPRPSGFSFKGSNYNLLIPEQLGLALRALCQQENVTLYMALLAGFQLLLQQYSGQDDFGVGTPIANRNHIDLEKIIGLFINMLVIRVNMTGNPTLREFLTRVKTTTMEAFGHQEVNFEILVEMLHPKRPTNRSPFFQVMFILQNLSLRPFQISGLETSMTEIDTQTSKFDLSLYIYEQGPGELLCKFEYPTDIYELETIQQMGANYQILLEEMVSRPDLPIRDIAGRLTIGIKKQPETAPALITDNYDTGKDREEFEL